MLVQPRNPGSHWVKVRPGRNDSVLGMSERALIWPAQYRATTLRPLDLYPMAPGLRGSGNLTLEGMPIPTNRALSIDSPKRTAMRDAVTICSPSQRAARALAPRRCEEHQSRPISRIGDCTHRPRRRPPPSVSV